jgi:predicted MFS family arabinose efflux permease
MPDSGHTERRSRSRARGLVVAMLATAVSSNVGFAFGVLGPALRADLGVSRTALGALASAFFAATGAASVTAAKVVRTIGAGRGAAFALGAEFIVCMVAGLAGGYALLLAVAVLTGAAYALVNVASNRIVRVLASDDRLGRYMTVKTAGVPIAAAIVGVLSGLIARWGWRPMVVGLGLWAGLVAVTVVRTFDRVGPPAVADRWDADRLGPGFLFLPAAAFCFIAGSQPLYTWVPSYLHESLGVGAGTAAVLSGLATTVGIPAMLVIARFADYVGSARRPQFLAALCAVTAAAMVLVLLARSVGVGVAVAGLVVGVSANLALAGLFPAVIVEYAPNALERATGVAMTGYYSGAVAAPIGFGALADRSGGYTVPWSVCVTLLAAGVVLCLLVHAFTPRGAASSVAVPNAVEAPMLSSPVLDE